MNKIHYFLVFIPVTLFFFTLDSAIVNIFFPDSGNMGWVPGQTFSKYFISLYILSATAFSGFQLRYLGRSKVLAGIPFVMLCAYLFVSHPLLVFGTFIFCFIIGCLSKKEIIPETVTIGKNLSTWKVLLFAIVILYLSAGFFFLGSPFKTSNHAMGGALADCYDAEYLNLFSFKITAKSECRGGI